MDQFSSVIPFWKPHNVSILPRRGGDGPPPPPTDAPVLKPFQSENLVDNFFSPKQRLNNPLWYGLYCACSLLSLPPAGLEN